MSRVVFAFHTAMFLSFGLTGGAAISLVADYQKRIEQATLAAVFVTMPVTALTEIQI